MSSLKCILTRSIPLLFCAGFVSAAPIPPPQADTVINIPATAASAEGSDPVNDCYVGEISFAGSDVTKHCVVTFPITVPVGHAIKQITVLHSNNWLYPDPDIHGYLDTRQFVAPYSHDDAFVWDSSTPVPGGTIEATRLMSQLGNTYYDAFTVDSGTTYSVVVWLFHGAVINGLQITYN
jgi:hypothetical protein